MNILAAAKPERIDAEAVPRWAAKLRIHEKRVTKYEGREAFASRPSPTSPLALVLL